MHRSRPMSLVPLFSAFAAALVTAGLAVAGTGGVATVPWWLVCFALCLALPRGSWSSADVRGRLAAVAALLVAVILLVGGLASVRSAVVLLPVAAALWVSLTSATRPALHGRPVIGSAALGVAVALTGVVLPLSLSAIERPAVNLAAGFAAVAVTTGPVLLLVGSALLVGTIGDLVARLRQAVSTETARSIAFVVGGAALVLVAAAGVLASTTVGTRPLGLGGVGVAAVALVLLGRGLSGLGRTREVAPTGSVLTTVAVAAVFTGSLLPSASALVSVAGLVVLLLLAAALGAVAGLCGAAVLLRSHPHLALPASATTRLSDLRTRAAATIDTRFGTGRSLHHLSVGALDSARHLAGSVRQVVGARRAPRNTPRRGLSRRTRPAMSTPLRRHRRSRPRPLALPV